MTTTPNMKLIYHPRSPYSRISYILAHERSLTPLITLHKVVVCPVDPFPGWSDNNAEVSQSNPLAKIPTLVVPNISNGGGEIGLFDSRVICEYLEHLASTNHSQNSNNPHPQSSSRVEKGSALYFKQQAVYSAALGILDAEVLCTYEERIREPAGVFYQPWFDGQKKKNVRAMNFLNQAVKKDTLKAKQANEAVEVADIAVAVVCGNLDSKGIEWRTARRELAEWFEVTWSARRSWIESPVERDWVGGGGGEKL